MRYAKSFICAGLLLGAAAVMTPSAGNAMPLTQGAGSNLATQADELAPVVDVQFRRRGRGWGPGVGIGAAIGTAVIIGGMMAAQAEAEAAARQDAVAYCTNRFRSYNPETGTYVDLKGRVRTCP